jgi:hypothetical protein
MVTNPKNAADRPADDWPGGGSQGGRPDEPQGGEAACWLDRVCPYCDAVLDSAPPVLCPRCGAEVRPEHER